MNLIDWILNLAGLFLWIDWRSGAISKRPRSIRRNVQNRMEIIHPTPRKKTASVTEILQRNKLLVMLAAFGLFLSAGQLFRR